MYMKRGPRNHIHDYTHRRRAEWGEEGQEEGGMEVKRWGVYMCTYITLLSAGQQAKRSMHSRWALLD